MMASATRAQKGLWAKLTSQKYRGPLLVAPAIIMLFVMNIFPLLWSFGLSFFNYRANRLNVPDFVGFKNFERVLTDEKIWDRFQTTAIIVASSVTLQLIIGFGLALLFAKHFPMRRIIMMLVLTPMMLSFVSVGVFFKLYYEPSFGLLSYFMNFFTAEPFALLSTTTGAIAGIVIADAWMWSPFVMLLIRYATAADAKRAHRNFRAAHAPGWREQTAVNIPGGGWTSTCLVQETVAVVIGAPARRDVRQLIHEVQQLLQDPGGDP